MLVGAFCSRYRTQRERALLQPSSSAFRIDLIAKSSRFKSSNGSLPTMATTSKQPIPTKKTEPELSNIGALPETSGGPPSKKPKVGATSKESDAGTTAAPTGSGNFEEQISKTRAALASSVLEFRFNKKRVRAVSNADDMAANASGILYWMSRDQRVQDNWALLYAQRLALKQRLPLYVCFCLVPKFMDATIRHFGFMLRGLQEVEKEFRSLDISFHLLKGYAKDVLPPFVNEKNIGAVVTDFLPLRVPRQWVKDLKKALPKNVPLAQVDAHNVVPCWVTSDKLEYGARTIRRKIHDKLPQFFTEFPPAIKHTYPAKSLPEETDWEAAWQSLEVDRSVGEVAWAQPGTSAGLEMLNSFINERLKLFSTDRNNPNSNALSNLSPWIHFGQISVQRCALEVSKLKPKYRESVDMYIEEAIVRRELGDNFCFYNKNYDSLDGAYDWAKRSLDAHTQDNREYIYSLQQLEEAKTHDPLWNAAQLQMVVEGKMHGFMRMYWAKKILEWTSSPEEALRIAIYLNDRYQLDGSDPNGYVGCMWSICGTHDQGWAERAVFGKIRYMNYAGCKRKFDVGAYESRYSSKKLGFPAPAE
uniref:Deoxyribodipyrimidine photo-lyase n=1 Tax=Petromyzon marinus TaxID=7757 RepID=A0AAJ7SKR0_PETMA|nr:deoxyribodipyrimidine photo-lyase-like isoform X2 [Petromyzon marinus]